MERHWNYRVIEFVDPEDDKPWRAIHEVHYEDGKPVSYAENHASVIWDSDDGDTAATETLDKMRSAITKPVLFERDFKIAYTSPPHRVER